MRLGSIRAFHLLRHFLRRCRFKAILTRQLLVVGGDALKQGVEEVRERFRGTPHIFNLGHGITPQASPENVAELVRLVKGA